MKKATLQFMLIALVALTLLSFISLRTKSESCSIACSAPVKTETPMLWDLLTSRFSTALFLR